MSYINRIPMSYSGYGSVSFDDAVKGGSVEITTGTSVSVDGTNVNGDVSGVSDKVSGGGEAPSSSLEGGAVVPLMPLMTVPKMTSTYFTKCVRAPWQPPDVVFGPVWAFLYTLYFIILAKTWKSKSSRNSLLIGLALNVAWVPAFAYNSKLALVILALMIGVAYDTSRRLEIDGYATQNRWFQCYIVWLLFAFSLNLYIAVNCKS